MRPHLLPFSIALALATSGCAGGMMGGPPMHRPGMEEGGMAMMMAMGPLVGCPAQDSDAQLSRLHATLGITAAQEPAWSAYADAYRRHAGDMGAMQHQMGPATAPDRARQHTEMMERHVALMRALSDALSALYAVLTPAQRASADALACEPGMRRAG